MRRTGSKKSFGTGGTKERLPNAARLATAQSLTRGKQKPKNGLKKMSLIERIKQVIHGRRNRKS